MLMSPNNVSLVDMLANQETTALMNAGRQVELKKNVQDFQNKQQAQVRVAEIYKKRQQDQSQVSTSTITKLASSAGITEDKKYIESLKADYDSNMEIANAIAPYDMKEAEEYRKLATASRDAAFKFGKQSLEEKKVADKELGGVLNAGWQSKEAFDTIFGSGGELEKTNPELAETIRKRFPNGLTEEAARSIHALAESKMSAEVQTQREIARANTAERISHDKEVETEKRQADADRRREVEERREERRKRASDKQTTAQKANYNYIKVENSLTKEYDNDYDKLHKEYRSTYDKWSKATGEEKTALAEDLNGIAANQQELTQGYESKINKAKDDARTYGADHPRIDQEYKAHPAVSKQHANVINSSYTSTVPNMTPDALIKQVMDATEKKRGKRPDQKEVEAGLVEIGYLVEAGKAPSKDTPTKPTNYLERLRMGDIMSNDELDEVSRTVGLTAQDKAIIKGLRAYNRNQ